MSDVLPCRELELLIVEYAGDHLEAYSAEFTGRRQCSGWDHDRYVY